MSRKQKQVQEHSSGSRTIPLHQANIHKSGEELMPVKTSIAGATEAAGSSAGGGTNVTATAASRCRGRTRYSVYTMNTLVRR